MGFSPANFNIQWERACKFALKKITFQLRLRSVILKLWQEIGDTAMAANTGCKSSHGARMCVMIRQKRSQPRHGMCVRQKSQPQAIPGCHAKIRAVASLRNIIITASLRATRCPNSCCAQSYPAFLQDVVSTTRTHDLLVI